MNVLRQTSIVGVLGIGMTFVILTAGIDLSVGATLALSAVLLAGTLESTGNIVAGDGGRIAGRDGGRAWQRYRRHASAASSPS